MKSILIPITTTKRAIRYSIRDDAMVPARWQFCIRLLLGWPLVRFGWRIR